MLDFAPLLTTLTDPVLCRQNWVARLATCSGSMALHISATHLSAHEIMEVHARLDVLQPILSEMRDIGTAWGPSHFFAQIVACEVDRLSFGWSFYEDLGTVQTARAHIDTTKLAGVLKRDFNFLCTPPAAQDQTWRASLLRDPSTPPFVLRAPNRDAARDAAQLLFYQGMTFKDNPLIVEKR